MSVESVYKIKEHHKRQTEVTDCRNLLFSCHDLGGTNASDDWMYNLAGGGVKYESMGLGIYESLPYHTSLKAKLMFSLTIDKTPITTWGNLHCDSCYSDRVVMSSPYWGNGSRSLQIEILMIAAGTCYITIKLKNISKNQTYNAKFNAAFVNELFDITKIKNSQTTLQHNQGTHIFKLLTNKSAQLKPGKELIIEAIITSAADLKTAKSLIKQAQAVDLDAFRKKQNTLSHPTYLNSLADQSDKHLAASVHNILRANLLGYKDSFYTAPNRAIHKGHWLWDSCFHCFAWDLFDKKKVEQILDSFFWQQEADGFLPIAFNHIKRKERAYATQPPLIAWVAATVTKNKKLINKIYPSLCRFNDWLEKNRQLSNGLFQWKTAGESGMDNSPRFDDAPGKEVSNAANLDHCSRVINNKVAHIDLSAMMALHYKSMAQLAETIGNVEDVKKWQKKYNSIKKKINQFLYDPKTKFYHDRQISGKWNKLKTIAAFWTLIAEIPGKTQAKAVVKHLMNPAEFFTPLPVPSVAIDEKSFCFNYWRGPVWINTCYMVVAGLNKMGFDKEAKLVGQRVVDGIKKELSYSGYFWEIYDPFAGSAADMEKKRQGPRQNAIGFCGWTANVLNILEEIKD